MEKTLEQYRQVQSLCASLFAKKLRDYGAAWRILRLPSLTDQIYIKAQRLRSLEQLKQQKVADEPAGEYIGIVNYAIMALLQLEHGVAEQVDWSPEQAEQAYQRQSEAAQALMERKNHDYGEAWRQMRLSSLTDLILQKILRVKQIEDNQGLTEVSEGLDANYYDMVNYALFALIKIEEAKGAPTTGY